ncbi:hypothetical protein, partial [Achromobacter sp.]|uniref:hypothetical protein n=1 Tax=Achromobacter sp. TaxID=134375 RepID=UPI00289DE93B
QGHPHDPPGTAGAGRPAAYASGGGSGVVNGGIADSAGEKNAGLEKMPGQHFCEKAKFQTGV